MVKSNKPLINLLSIFSTNRLLALRVHVGFTSQARNLLSTYNPLHKWTNERVNEWTPVHVCMMIKIGNKSSVVGHSPHFIINFFSITFFNFLLLILLSIPSTFPISFLVPLFCIYIKMTQENVIVGGNNKKNDKDNILLKVEREMGQRQRDMNYLLLCKKWKKNVKNMLLPFSRFPNHWGCLPYFTSTPVTRLENKICWDSLETAKKICHCGGNHLENVNGELKCIIKFIINFLESLRCYRCHRWLWREAQFEVTKLNIVDAMTRNIRADIVEVN